MIRDLAHRVLVSALFGVVALAAGGITWVLGLTIPDEIAFPLIVALIIGFARAQYKIITYQWKQRIRDEYEHDWRRTISAKVGVQPPPTVHHRRRRRSRQD